MEKVLELFEKISKDISTVSAKILDVSDGKDIDDEIAKAEKNKKLLQDINNATSNALGQIKQKFGQLE